MPLKHTITVLRSIVNLKADLKWAVLVSIIPGVLIGFLASMIAFVWPLVLIVEVATGIASVRISLSRSRISSSSDSLVTGGISGLMAGLIGAVIFIYLMMHTVLALVDSSRFFTLVVCIFPIPGMIVGALGGLAYYHLRRR